VTQSNPNSTPGENKPQFSRYVARQPILSSDKQVFGYEILFRNGVENYFSHPDPDAASRSTLDASLLMGIDILCDGRSAFVNCTRDTLLKDYITLLPPQRTVVEILESVVDDDLIRSSCVRLKNAGYPIALDDFIANDPRDGLVQYADFIKVDMKRTTAEERVALVKRYAAPGRRMLAEKVETREEYQVCKKAGFSYFQGYFFRRPELMQARDIPANRLNYLRLMRTISQNEVDPKEIEDIIKSEASLCYRLLRYLNSAAFAFSSEIHSVRHALAILGEREVRRWVRLVATLGVGQDKPSDLVLSALVRARYGELLAPRVPHGDSDLFLVGLLSLMDAILELPMGVVLEGIGLDRETRAVLLGQEGPLDPIYRLMLSHEVADWPQISELCSRLKLPEAFVIESHWKAMQWAQETTSGLASASHA
jgi:EAL and modified HD-GYP domain-containing signal transduction protein